MSDWQTSTGYWNPSIIEHQIHSSPSRKSRVRFEGSGCTGGMNGHGKGVDARWRKSTG